MIDFALSWNAELQALDWTMAGPDLALDQGLYSAVAISLLSDALAPADAEIPDGSTDRRGWWGDQAIQGGGALGGAQNPDGQPDHIGSLLWLLARAKATPATAALARQYCQAALQWLIDDGAAAQVAVASTWLDNVPPMLGISIAISRFTGPGQQTTHTYDAVWDATLSQLASLTYSGSSA